MAKKHKKHTKEGDDTDDKSLKLVLKVGASTDTPGSDYDDRKHKHRKKKKKKDKHREKPEKRKRGQEDDTVDDEDDVPLLPSSTKRALFDVTSDSDSRHSDTKMAVPLKPPSKGLITLLCMQHASLQKKDVNQFFAYPVTDSIAPGYSERITNPMDMSTMKIKIDSGEYHSVQEYMKDFKLMCDNCTEYNRPETIFYKEAKRMYAIATRQLSKEKLLMMRHSHAILATVTADELGVDPSELVGGDMSNVGTTTVSNSSKTSTAAGNTDGSTPAGKKPKPKRWDAVDKDDEEEIAAEVILAQAKAAAAAAKDNLTTRAPNSKFGFLRRSDDGTTTLNILNPDNNGFVDDKTRVVDLGSLTGKISSGMGCVGGFKEDKRNKVTPVTALNYGPFSAYAPTYDSTFANITKEESELLLSTYGNDSGLEYAKSIHAFAANSCDYAVDVVDSLLDSLTDGAHSAAMKQVRQKDIEDAKAKEEAEAAAAKENEKTTDDSDAENNTQADNLSFLQRLAESSGKEKTDTDLSLDKTADLLGQLQKTQYDRLSKPVTTANSAAIQPTQEEQQIASDVATGLVGLVKQTGPGHVVSTSSIRAALGITESEVQDTQSTTSDQPGDNTADITDQPMTDVTNTNNLTNQPASDVMQAVTSSSDATANTAAGATSNPDIQPQALYDTNNIVSTNGTPAGGIGDVSAPTPQPVQNGTRTDAASAMPPQPDSNTQQPQQASDSAAAPTAEAADGEYSSTGGGLVPDGNLPSELAEFFTSEGQN